MTEKFQIVLFLRELKAAVGERFVLVPRKTNLDALARKGLTVADAKEVVLGLMPAGYCSGPETNRNHPSTDVWVFGSEVDGDEMYIKLEVRQGPSRKCICISFHEASSPLHYPFR